jgi:superfamily II helicase
MTYRIVNPARPLKQAAAIIPTLTRRKDQRLRRQLEALVTQLQAADAPIYQAVLDYQYERISEAEFDAKHAAMVAAYDALAAITEHMPIPL